MLALSEILSGRWGRGEAVTDQDVRDRIVGGPRFDREDHPSESQARVVSSLDAIFIRRTLTRCLSEPRVIPEVRHPNRNQLGWTAQRVGPDLEVGVAHVFIMNYSDQDVKRFLSGCRAMDLVAPLVVIAHPVVQSVPVRFLR